MKVYLYSSMSSSLNFFNLSKACCAAYFTNRKQVKSIGLCASKFLFVTLKKLDASQRRSGFENEQSEYPIVFEFDCPSAAAKTIPVRLLKNDGTLDSEFKSLNLLNNKFLGAFIAGEISFSYLSKVFFESDEDKEAIYRPFKDLFFPENLYGIIGTEEKTAFNQQLDITSIRNAAGNLDDEFKDNKSIVETIKNRNSAIAVLLNVMLETKSWPYDNGYLANFDSVSLAYLRPRIKIGKNTENLAKKNSSGKYEDAALSELLSLSDNIKGGNAELLKLIIEKIKECNGRAFGEADLSDLARRVVERNLPKAVNGKGIQDYFKGLQKIYTGSPDISVEKWLHAIPTEYEAFKALLFFVRNPNTLKLDGDLEAYHAAAKVRRYSWVLAAVAYGLAPVAGEKKRHGVVYQIAEEEAMKQYPSDSMISEILSKTKIPDDFSYKIESGVNEKTVQNYLLSEDARQYLPSIIEKFLQKKQSMKKIYRCKSIHFGKLLKLMKEKNEVANLTDQELKDLTQIYTDGLREIKKNTYEVDWENFLREQIEPEEAFHNIYAGQVTFWNKIYLDGAKR